MASTPPTLPPYDYRDQRRQWRDQQRAARDQWKAQRAQMKMQSRMHYSYMRRGSILGPLILIALGVFFLLASLHRINAAFAWSWFGHAWPLILVFAGVVLLAEWAVDEWTLRNHPDALPVRRGIGGGVGLLLVLLILAGLVASGTNNINWNWLRSQINTNNDDDLNHWFGEEHQTDESQVIDMPKGAGLTIENPYGDVVISGVSSDGKVHLTMHKTVYVNGAPDSAFKQLEPLIVPGSTNVDIHMPQMDSGHATMTVTVPALSTLFVKVGRGDVHVSNLAGAVSVIADRGDVEMDGITTQDGVTGQVVVHMKQGDFTAHEIHGAVVVNGKLQNATIAEVTGAVTLEGEFGTDVNVEHVRGEFQYDSPRTRFEVQRINGNVELGGEGVTGADIVGPVVLSTRSRNVEFQRVSGPVSVKDSNGNVELSTLQPLANIEITTTQGSIDVTVPTHSVFGLDAETQGGEVDHDFEDAGLRSNHVGQKAMLSGSVGSGGPQLRLSTTHDNIMLHRGTNVGFTLPAPPAVPRVPRMPSKPHLTATKPDDNNS